MKLIIDIDDSDYERIKDLVANDANYTTATTVGTAYQVIANGIPVSNDGDLIRRDALKKALHNFFDGKVIDEPAYILRDVFCYIEGAPSVEPHYVSDLPDDVVKTLQTLAIDYSDGLAIFERKRPKGKMIIKPPSGWGYCSECGKVLEPQDKFCWNCGAEMVNEV